MPERRRLAAIMFTDLVGFTKLGQDDEEEALRLRTEHQGILRPIFAAHGGREVKSLGDGFLVEFPSAIDSTRCAVEIQQKVAERNSAPGAHGRLQLRIGIHVGDVVGDGDDIVGDAVNVASRIEALADAGGVCVSGSVYDQVRNKLRLPLEKIGARTLKNVTHPVDVYRILLWGDADRPAVDTPGAVRLAVLPLANMSPDVGDGYFADGLTDELISQASKIPGLRVIPRTSVQRYKDATKSLRDVAQDLGVRLALEGSVRKSGNRVRITVQLVDPTSEESLWSYRYDRALDDIFAIQDDIAGQIAASLTAHVRGGAAPAAPPYVAGGRETENLEAYTQFLHGRKLLSERTSEESMREAVRRLESAVALDPKFARAHARLAEGLLWLATEGAADYFSTTHRAEAELAVALGLDERLAEAHSCLAAIHLAAEQRADAYRESRRAVELNPSLAEPYRWLAQLAASERRIDDCVRLLETAFQIDPLDVNVIAFLGHAYLYARRYGDALAHWERSKPIVAFRTNAHLTEYYLSQGEYEKAQGTLREMERIRPTSAWAQCYRGILAARVGDAAGGRAAVEALRGGPEGREVRYFLAGFVEFALGDQEAFYASMERARVSGVTPALELMYSPLFDSARTDPRFREYVEQFVHPPESS